MTPSHFPRDAQELLALFSRSKVRYLIVGAEAVIYHGFARLTGDVDIFYEPSAANCRRLFRALGEFWKGAVPGIRTATDLVRAGMVIQFGYPPNRVDLINTISGVGFPEAWKGRCAQVQLIGRKRVRVHFIGLSALIKNKEACGRPKDLEDLKYLKEKARRAKSRRRE